MRYRHEEGGPQYQALMISLHGGTQVTHWEALRLDVPFAAVEVNAQRARYSVLRQRMQDVVRRYNKVSLLP